ncbi:T-complex protein 1 subunit theta, partial [Pancytospora epiphaga]
MDFGRTQISGLLNNVAHEKTRFMGLLHKLNTLLKLSNGHKLILTSLDKLLLTAYPGDIYDNVNYNHPILSILKEYLGKTSECPNGAPYFLRLVIPLIKEVNFLLDNGVRPKAISDVFKSISEIEVKDINKNEEHEIDGEEPTEQSILNGTIIELIRSVIKDSHIAGLLIECIEATKSFDTEKIRICKILSGSIEDSFRVDGMILNRKPEGRVTNLSNTSVGIFNCPMDINRTELKGTVLFRNHEELSNFSKDEVYRIKSFVDSLNVNVLVVCGKIDSLFLELANERNLMVLKAFSKFDLKRICDSVGGSIYNQLGPVKHKGMAKSVTAFVDGGYEFTKI